MPVRNNGNPLAIQLFYFFNQFSTKLACVYKRCSYKKSPIGGQEK